MEGLTSSEIAGFVVGALLLGATIAAPKVDGFIASSQRRSGPWLFPFLCPCLLFHQY
jgi:hypothetical protein